MKKSITILALAVCTSTISMGQTTWKFDMATECKKSDKNQIGVSVNQLKYMDGDNKSFSSGFGNLSVTDCEKNTSETVQQAIDKSLKLKQPFLILYDGINCGVCRDEAKNNLGPYLLNNNAKTYVWAALGDIFNSNVGCSDVKSWNTSYPGFKGADMSFVTGNSGLSGTNKRSPYNFNTVEAPMYTIIDPRDGTIYCQRSPSDPELNGKVNGYTPAGGWAATLVITAALDQLRTELAKITANEEAENSTVYFNIFPNPATNHINVQLRLVESANLRWK